MCERVCVGYFLSMSLVLFIFCCFFSIFIGYFTLEYLSLMNSMNFGSEEWYIYIYIFCSANPTATSRCIILIFGYRSKSNRNQEPLLFRIFTTEYNRDLFQIKSHIHELIPQDVCCLFIHFFHRVRFAWAHSQTIEHSRWQKIITDVLLAVGIWFWCEDETFY